MEKIILYYKFVPIEDPESVMAWQRILCESNGLKGRILISKHGINGTLGGPIDGLKNYVKAMKLHSKFKGITWKWSEGGADNFPRLSVKVRSEIVSFGVPDEVVVNEHGVVGGGKHLKPAQINELVKKRGKDVIFYDGRNAYEAHVGKFDGTIVPKVRTSKDFIADIESGEIAKHKDKPIVTYCTGGIRCEILSALMINRGYEEVYQIDGGIVKYGETYKDNEESLWKGKLYVFDGRMVTAFSDNAEDIGTCSRCKAKTSNFENCANLACNDLIVLCDTCAQTMQACSEKCQKLVQQKVTA